MYFIYTFVVQTRKLIVFLSFISIKLPDFYAAEFDFVKFQALCK